MDEVKAAQDDPVAETRVDRAVQAAQSLPDLIARAKAVDPDLADGLQRYLDNPWTHGPAVAAATTILTACAARYGLGWDAPTSGAVATALVAGAWYLAQWFKRLF